MCKLMLKVADCEQEENQRVLREISPSLAILKCIKKQTDLNFAVRAEIFELVIQEQRHSRFGNMCARVLELCNEFESNGLILIESMYKACPIYFEHPILKTHVPSIRYLMSAMDSQPDRYRP